MGAVLIGERVRQLRRQSHGSTFGGNPLACAAGLAALMYIEERTTCPSARPSWAPGSWGSWRRSNRR